MEKNYEKNSIKVLLSVQDAGQEGDIFRPDMLRYSSQKKQAEKLPGQLLQPGNGREHEYFINGKSYKIFWGTPVV